VLEKDGGLCGVTHNNLISFQRAHSSATAAAKTGLGVCLTGRAEATVDAEGSQIGLTFSEDISANIEVGLDVHGDLMGHGVCTKIHACPRKRGNFFGSCGERRAAVQMPT
jgi:hypothetical protein